MTGLQEMERAREAGFTDVELSEWLADERKKALSSGFSTEEFDAYWGKPPFDAEPVKAQIHETLRAATQPTTDGGQPKPVTNFTDALKAGFGESVTGLLMGKPTTTLAEDAPRSSRIAAYTATLAGDIPAMIGGAFVGGTATGPLAPVGAMAGAFALPAGMRRILMDKYEKGEVQGFGDFWDRFSGAFVDTAKGYITGAVTGAVGKGVGLLPILSPTVKAAAIVSSEIATMVTVGKALEGQMPEPNDFIDTALTLGFVKGSVKVASKLRHIYAETGVKPDEVAADVQRDPTILHDLASEDVAIPKSYTQPPASDPVQRSPEQRERYLLALQGKLPIPETVKALPAPEAKALPEPAIEPTKTQSGQQSIDVPPPTVGERPIIGREVSADDDAPLFNLSQRTPAAEQLDAFGELSRADLAITPRHKMPLDQNAEMLARAEKALADFEMAGQERGGLYFEEQSGHGGTNIVTGLKSATADWYKEATTGQKKLSAHRVEVALRKIIDGKGRDVGTDVQRIKELLIRDHEYESSPFAPKTEEEWGRARQYAMAEWEPDVAMGGGAPPKPPGLPAPATAATPPPKQNLPVGTPQQAILQRIVKDDTKPSRTLDDLYTSVFDNLHPINMALKGIKALRTPTGENPYALERLTRGTFGKGSEFINHGAFDFETYKTVTRGYREILEPVKDDLDGFRAYMLAKRAIELSGKGIESGIPLVDATKVVAQGKAKYEKVHQERIEYRNAMLDYLQKSGILNKKAVEAMKEANKDYVPFYRFFEDEGGRPATSKSVKQPVRRIKGSEREILDPIVSDIKDTFLFIGLAEKNAARQAFVKLPGLAEKQADPVKATALTEPEIQRLFDEFVSIKKQASNTQTSTSTTTTGGTGPQVSKQTQMIVARVRDALLARGFQPGEADQMMRRVGEAEAGKVGATVQTVIKEIETTTYIPEMDIRLPNDAATVFRAMQKPLAKDEVAVYVEGKREVYKMDPKVAEAFEDLDRVSTNIITNMLVHTPAELLRAGVTLSPDFMARNVMRDAVAAFIYAGSNPIKTALGMKSLVMKDTAYHNWLKGGGANATMVAMDRDYIHNHLMKLDLETGVMRRAWNVVRTPLDVLRATSELVENATRLGAVRSELLQSQDKARIQALSLIAREATVDFSRHGRDTQEFSRMTAFFNPALQGIDRFGRALKDQPIATLTKGFAAVTLPSLLLWYANKDDEEIQNLPRWQKDMFWIARVPLKDGGSFLLRIPKPHEIGIIFGTIPERLMEEFVKDNPDAWKGMSETFFNAFLPSMIPTAAVPVVEQFANRDEFTGMTLIPAYAEKLLPEYQYTEYTTETAKALGHIFAAFPGMEKLALKQDTFSGVARALTTPILIENYVRSWSGGMGAYALQLADMALKESGVVPDPVLPARTLSDIPFVKAFVVRYPSASAQSIQDFYDTFSERERTFATIQKLAREGDPRSLSLLDARGYAMVRLTDLKETLTEHGKLIRDIYNNPDMTSSDKRQLIDTLYYRMIELSQAGNLALHDIDAQQP